MQFYNQPLILVNITYPLFVLVSITKIEVYTPPTLLPSMIFLLLFFLILAIALVCIKMISYYAPSIIPTIIVFMLLFFLILAIIFMSTQMIDFYTPSTLSNFAMFLLICFSIFSVVVIALILEKLIVSNTPPILVLMELIILVFLVLHFLR